MAFDAVVSLLSAVWLGRTFGPKIYGDLRILSIAQRVFGWIQSGGTQKAYVYYTLGGSPPVTTRGHLFGFQAGLALLLCAAALAGSGWLLERLHASMILGPWLALAFLPIVLAWEPGYLGPLRGMLLLEQQAKARFSGAIVFLGSLIGGVMAGLQGGALVLAFFLSSIATIVVARRFLQRGGGAIPAGKGPPPTSSSVVAFAAWQTAAALGLFLAEPMSFIWLKASHGDPVAAGGYAAASSVANLARYLWVPASAAVLPLLNLSLVRDAPQEAGRVLRAFVVGAAIFGFPLVGLGVPVCRALVPIVFGLQFREGAWAAGILYAGGCAHQGLILACGVMTACGLTAPCAAVAWGALAAQGLLLWACVPGLGPVGAACAFAASCSIAIPPAVYWARRRVALKGRWPWRPLLTGAVLSAGASTATAWTGLGPWPTLAACAALYPLCVLAIWHASPRADREDWRAFVNRVQKIQT